MSKVGVEVIQEFPPCSPDMSRLFNYVKKDAEFTQRLYWKYRVVRILPIVVLDGNTKVSHTTDSARVDSDHGTLFIGGGVDAEKGMKHG